MSQEMDTLLPGMTLDSFKQVEGENKLRLRQLNGSSSDESLSVKISSNSKLFSNIIFKLLLSELTMNFS